MLLHFSRVTSTIIVHASGVALAIVIAAAATLISEHQGGPGLLYALLLGMALKSVTEGSASAPGIAFASRTVLRFGIALLGLKIGIGQVEALGLGSAILVVAAVGCTIVFGMWLARRLGLRVTLGLVTGGATAICGASAALAIGSLLPQTPDDERDTTFAVVAVTALSTIAMILYPAILHAVDAGDSDAGFFIGATVHDVAQVVGAGYMISPEAGDIATVTKLFRVALLIPVTLIITALGRTTGSGAARVRVPWFLALFVIFAALHSTGLVPEAAIASVGAVSRWCLVIAIAGVGLKTSLGDFRAMGLRPLGLVLAETVFLAALIGAGVMYR